MFGLGPTELLIVLAIILLLFGGSRIPQIARALGAANKEFKKASEGNEAPKKSKSKSKAAKAKN